MNKIEMPDIEFLKESKGARAMEIQPNGTKQYKQINIPAGTKGMMNAGLFKTTIAGKQYEVAMKMGSMNIYKKGENYTMNEDPQGGYRRKTRKSKKSKKSKKTRRHH
jgi:hypothetical protein